LIEVRDQFVPPPPGGPAPASGGSSSPPPRGTVGPTSWRLLLVLFAVGAVLGYGIVAVSVRTSGFAPRVQWSAVFGLLGLVILVGGLAYSTYRTVHRDRRPIESRRAVNLLLGAKASALAGAVTAGGYIGFAVPFLNQLDIALPRERVIRSVCAAVAALLLLVAGLLLERACRVPKIDSE
jgi:Protein of unknown function (DUF3180)